MTTTLTELQPLKVGDKVTINGMDKWRVENDYPAVIIGEPATVTELYPYGIVEIKNASWVEGGRECWKRKELTVVKNTDAALLLEKRGQPLDPIEHPVHYARWKMEPIEFIAINNLPWWLANVIKYTMRFDAKDGLQDLYKARSYLDMKIRQTEGIVEFWAKPVAIERALNRGDASPTV